MDAARWGRVKQVLADAQEIPLPDRRAWLDNALKDDDPEVRREAISLFCVLHEMTEDPLEQPPFAAKKETALEGSHAGPYRLQHRIGGGGMGDVYVASRDDDQFRKRVAVKLVRPGMQETAEILQRFRTERQVMAALDHPRIVKLLDAGTTADGIPYLVMDYVEGVPIDVYCQRNRLSVAERLRLFIQVCQAVHYAHQNLVIHRDLKPANILVTPAGEPKLLDFGIAKLLSPGSNAATMVTRVDARPMTPMYASPEQLRGDPVTTASDVYSLGVVLYQLLTGQSPYGPQSQSSISALEHAICEQDPEKPSSVVTRPSEPPRDQTAIPEGDTQKWQRRLAGDLDVIVLMAMRKEPARRYASAEQLAADLQFHLDGRPVLARSDTAFYRVSKFVQRNRLAVVAGAVALLSLLAGAGVSLWEARHAQRERERAERRFNDVRKLANWFLFDFHQMIRDLPGSTAARKQLIGKSLEYLDSLAKESAGDPSLQAELAAAYVKVGEVQYETVAANMGDPAGAQASLRKAIEAAERAVAAAPAERQYQATLARARQGLASVEGALGRTRDAAGHLRQACTAFEALKSGEGGMPVDWARCLLRLGDTLGHPYFPNIGDSAGAMDAFQKALAAAENLMASTAPLDARRQNLPQLLFSASQRVGDMEMISRQSYREAIVHYDRALQVISRVAADEPSNGSARRSLGIIHHRLGQALAELGEFPRARQHHAQALVITESLVAADANNADGRRSLSLSYEKIGNCEEKAGEFAAALAAYRKCAAIRESLHAAEPANLIARRDLAIAHRNIGAMQIRKGERGPGDESFARALNHFRALVAAEPGNGQYRAETAQAMVFWASALEKSGARDQAAAVRARWLEQLREYAERPGATPADKSRYAKATERR